MAPPVRRCQSPISTARANAVNVEIPAGRPADESAAVYSLLAAKTTICSSTGHDGRLPSLPTQAASEATVVDLIEAETAQPRIVLPVPCRRVHVAMTQQQLARAVPGAHQFPTNVLTGGPDPGLIPERWWARSPGDLAHPEQPGGRTASRTSVLTRSLPGGSTSRAPPPRAVDSRRSQRPVQAIPRRPGLVSDRDRPGQLRDPPDHHVVVRDEPFSTDLTSPHHRWPRHRPCGTSSPTLVRS